MKKETKKPIAKITGQNGNVFVTLGICVKALKGAGLNDEVKDMTNRVFASASYTEAIGIMSDYCKLQ